VAKKYWLCVKCGTRHERTKQKCPCGRARPKRRVPFHLKTLQNDPYEVYLQFSANVHDNGDGSCDVCGRPQSDERRHDRDHGRNRNDPAYGNPRGVVCASCNILMRRELTLERATQICGYLYRVNAFYTGKGAR